MIVVFAVSHISIISLGRSVFVADIDGDGDLDILLANFDSSSVGLYKNEDGLGKFSARIEDMATESSLSSPR